MSKIRMAIVVLSATIATLAGYWLIESNGDTQSKYLVLRMLRAVPPGTDVAKVRAWLLLEGFNVVATVDDFGHPALVGYRNREYFFGNGMVAVSAIFDLNEKLVECHSSWVGYDL